MKRDLHVFIPGWAKQLAMFALIPLIIIHGLSSMCANSTACAEAIASHVADVTSINSLFDLDRIYRSAKISSGDYAFYAAHLVFTVFAVLIFITLRIFLELTRPEKTTYELDLLMLLWPFVLIAAAILIFLDFDGRSVHRLSYRHPRVINTTIIVVIAWTTYWSVSEAACQYIALYRIKAGRRRNPAQ